MKCIEHAYQINQHEWTCNVRKCAILFHEFVYKFDPIFTSAVVAQNRVFVMQELSSDPSHVKINQNESSSINFKWILMDIVAKWECTGRTLQNIVLMQELSSRKNRKPPLDNFNITKKRTFFFNKIQ